MKNNKAERTMPADACTAPFVVVVDCDDVDIVFTVVLPVTVVPKLASVDVPVLGVVVTGGNVLVAGVGVVTGNGVVVD